MIEPLEINKRIENIETAQELIKDLKEFIKTSKTKKAKKETQKPSLCRECVFFKARLDFDGDILYCYCDRPDMNEDETEEDYIISDFIGFIPNSEPPEWCFLK